MAHDRKAGELDQFLAERADPLMRTAVLLTGSREAGQDLLQTALERLLRHWRTLEGDPEAYLRRTLYNLATDGFRRQGRLRRKLLLLRAETRAPVDPTAEVDLRDALVRMPLQLPPRQRAVLVLRYWEQLTEAETAAVLGWPEGTVKSAASRGLRRLRELAEGWHQPGAKRRRAKGATGMNTDVEELLRDGMERFTARVQAPAGLAHTASRLRRRRLAVRAAVAAGPSRSPPRPWSPWPCGAGGPAQTGPTVAQAHTAAYVISRVEKALAGQHLVLYRAPAAAIGDRALLDVRPPEPVRGVHREHGGHALPTGTALTAADPSPTSR